MRRWSAWVTGWPRLFVAMSILVTILAAWFAMDVTMTTDVKDFFPADHEQVVTYDEIERTFGSAEFIMVALEMEDIFTSLGFETIAQLTRDLQGVPGISDVRSLTTVEEVKGTDWGVEVGPLLDAVPQTDEEFQRLRLTVLNDPMYSGSIVSPDGTAALHVLEVEQGADPVTVAHKVRDIVGSYSGAGQLYLTGTPVLNAILAESMKTDLKRLLPLVLLLVAVILFLFFRTVRGVVLPFLTVMMSLVWTLGLMGLLERQMSPLNAVMPVILVSLGNAYGIYLLARFNEGLKQGHDRITAVQKGMTSVGVAVLLAGSTTMAGFLATMSSEITQMRDFGLFTAIGVASALFISLSFVPSLWVLLPTTARETHNNKGEAESGSGGANRNRKGKGAKRQLRIGTLERWLTRWGEALPRRKGAVLLVTGLLVLGALAGLPRISTDSNFFNFFDPDSQPRVAYDLVADKFSGSESIEIVVRGDIQDPAVLEAMEAFQEGLEQTGLVGTPQSVVNVLKRTNRAMQEGDEAYYALPEHRDMVAQYLLLLEMSGDGFLDRFLTMDYSQARIQALVTDSSSEGTRRLFAAVEDLFEIHFAPLALDVTQTGIIALLDALADLIIDGQVKSLWWALGAVFVIVRLLLGSWQGSFLSTLLVFLTILGNFGLMGWLGIPLDIVTVLISSIGVGVGIDYSIHIYSRYQEEQRAGNHGSLAVSRTIASTGQAIFVNALAVISGFVILVTSSFPPFRYFGSLVTATMATAALGSLTLLPALILLLDGRRAKHRSKSTEIHGQQ